MAHNLKKCTHHKGGGHKEGVLSRVSSSSNIQEGLDNRMLLLLTIQAQKRFVCSSVLATVWFAAVRLTMHNLPGVFFACGKTG